MAADDEPLAFDAELFRRLVAFARGDGDGGDILPWAGRLAPPERRRLRSDLEVVLSEPALTGEPVDWGELGEILQEGAESAGWDGMLVHTDSPPADGAFTVHVQPRDEAALRAASPAVRRTVEQL